MLLLSINSITITISVKVNNNSQYY